MDTPKISITILLITISQILLGQSINAITTNMQAETFIKTSFPEYKDFKIGITLKSKKSKHYADSLHFKLFYKADFDGNGTTDLLVSGKPNEYEKAIVVMADPLGKYKAYDLVGWYRTWITPIAIVKQIDNQPIIILRQMEQHELSDSNKQKRNFNIDYKTYDFSLSYLDSLIYKWGQFINYNPSERQTHKKISKLSFNLYACYGKCPVYDFFIDSIGNAKLIAKAYNDRLQGEYKCRFDNISFTRLTNILNYVDLFRYENDYIVGWTDQATAIIDITFSDGTHKHIKDYGKMGGFGLRFLYQYFNGIRYTQQWQK